MMNTVIENLVERRSVRRYKSTPVPQNLIDEVLRAGTYAPTGYNRQSPIIIAVTDKKLRDRISKINAETVGIEGDPFYGAPVVLIVLADRKVPTYVYDESLVMGNMLNAAHSLGLGSCWINRAKETFDTDEGKALTVRDIVDEPVPTRTIRTHPICYSCSAGTGSSCGGSLLEKQLKEEAAF